MQRKELSTAISPNDMKGFLRRRNLESSGKRFPDSFQIPCRIWTTIKSLSEFSTRKSKRGRPAFADEKLKLRAILWNFYSGESLEATAEAFGLSERMLTPQIQKWIDNGFFHKLRLIDYNFIFGRNSIKDWNWMTQLEDHFSSSSNAPRIGTAIAQSTTEYKLPKGFQSWDEVFILSLNALGMENAFYLFEEFLGNNQTEIDLNSTQPF